MTTAKTLNTQNLIKLFDVSGMTIHTWRKGTPTRTPLPSLKEGNAVRFVVAEVKAWAKKHGIYMTTDPRELLGTGELPRGPKCRANAAAATIDYRAKNRGNQVKASLKNLQAAPLPP